VFFLGPFFGSLALLDFFFEFLFFEFLFVFFEPVLDDEEPFFAAPPPLHLTPLNNVTWNEIS